MTPSCISAHLTYMNIDYKYFAGSRDPIDIINKYRMRGFGTWLNENEKKILLKYSKHNIFWNNLYNISDQSNQSNVNGFFTHNHKLYHPRIYNLDYYHSSFPIDVTESYNIEIEYIKIESQNEFYTEISNRYKKSIKFNFLNNMQAIKNDGSINELQKWVIEACWSLRQNSLNIFTKITSKIDNTLNIMNKNKSNFINKKKSNYDISHNYNIPLDSNDKAEKLNKIQKNYTPLIIDLNITETLDIDISQILVTDISEINNIDPEIKNSIII